MITWFRKLSKSWVAFVLLGMIAVSFVIVGTVDPLQGGSGGQVIKAGSRTVSQTTFRQIMDSQINEYRQQVGREITMQEVVAQNGHLGVLEGLTTQEGFLSWLWKAGVRPGRRIIAEQIREFPVFFNEVTGQFDQELYATALARQNLTEAQFESELRDQIGNAHYRMTVMAGARAPRIYGALLAVQRMQTRDARWFAVTADMVETVAAPTDEQLTAYMNENPAQYRLPEYRTVSLAVFSPEPGATPPAVTDEQISERFAFRRDELSQPETRTFVTLTSTDAAAAARIAAALREGQSVSAVAEANDIDPVRYDNRPRSAVTDAAIAAAAFGLQAGQTSDPVQGALGHTVVQLVSVTAGREATLADVRDAIVQELRTEAVAAEVYARVERFDQAHRGGASMAEAAETAGARILRSPPFTQDGRLPDGQQFTAPAQVVSTAYNLEQGAESDVISVGQGQYFALRVDEVRAAATPPLADIRPVLTARWMARETSRRLTARADELAGRIRGGEDIATVAQSAGAPLVVRTGVQPSEASQAEVGQAVLQGIFSQGPEQVFTGQRDGASFVVGRVDRVHPPVAALAAPLAEQARPGLTVELVQTLLNETQSFARRVSKARNWPENALRALGIDPAAPPPAPAE